MDLIQTLILAIVEGITEFLPVSSTGHMIIASTIMGISSDEFVKLFEVVIQLGAILAVVVIYFQRFVPDNFREKIPFYLKLLVAFIPAAIVGFLLKKDIDLWLGSVTIVGIDLLLGGIVLLFVDNWFKGSEESPDKVITYPMAFKIGLFQAISILPGVSRAAATIIGGLTQKLNRRQAAEFSFFLAVPTMVAASALELKDDYSLITSDNIGQIIIGFIVAFIVAIIAIRTFINFLVKHGFRIFGVYRIIVGALVLIAVAMGAEFVKA
jgi:undecaprenyl-diphosphatase